MSPKVVNGSFAAIVDADEFLAKAYAGIRIAVSLRLTFQPLDALSAIHEIMFDKSSGWILLHF
jgi:hypothetical protein